MMSLTNNDTTDYSAVLEENDPQPSNTELLTNEQTLRIMRILMYGVTPAISVFGVVGNIFSMIILVKHGLHKSSNILLISLAFTDLTYLVAFNSIPKILYEVVGVEFAYEYSREASYLLFILFSLTNMLDYGMCSSTLSLPMLITLERLIAVYLPFKFNLIVTPVRTWCAVATVYTFWYGIYIYMAFMFTFTYTYSTEFNMTVGLMERSTFYFGNLDSVSAVEEIIDLMVMKIPPLVTLLGCVLISVKVTLASRKRKKMTQKNGKEVSSNRTTKMLLAVCVVYLITIAIQSLPTYVPQFVTWTLTNDAPSNLGRIMYQVINIAVCINSSVNFIVYVVMNKNFRETYKSLFIGCISKK